MYSVYKLFGRWWGRKGTDKQDSVWTMPAGPPGVIISFSGYFNYGYSSDNRPLCKVEAGETARVVPQRTRKIIPIGVILSEVFMAMPGRIRLK